MKRKVWMTICIFALVIALLAGMICIGAFFVRLHKTEKLIRAITNEDVAQVELLLTEGIDPNRTDVPAGWLLWTFLETSARRPLTIACGTGNLEIVKLLIDYGATAENVPGTGFSPLRQTLFYYHPDDVEMVNLLLENGAQPEDGYEEDIVFFATKMCPKVYDREMRNGTVFVDGYDETTAKGITEIVVTLLGDRPINSITYAAGKTLLMNAVQQENVYLTEYLLTAGADVSATDRQGKTAYDYAVATNNEEIISLLKG